MKRILLAVVLFAWLPRAEAGAFDPRCAPSEATWVAHVDVEAMGRSRFLLALHDAGQELVNDFDFDVIGSRFGVDPLRELASITLLPASVKSSDVVAVVRGSTQTSAAWSRLIEKSRFVRKVAGHDLYLVAGLESFASALPQESGGGRTFVVATSEAALVAELAVLDGTAKSLADATATKLDMRASVGAMFWASGSIESDRSAFAARSIQLLREIANLDQTEARTIAEHGRAFCFELGEDGADLFTRLELATATSSDAEALGDVLRGVVAKLKSSTGDSPASPRIERLTNPLRIEGTAARVRATYRYDARTFVDEVVRAEKELAVR
ncbi:MAG: hypothetical protein K8S98_19165 [Planctomycetes bacterium]|nr:hypothetical protein [Planctomycetota bacterium]